MQDAGGRSSQHGSWAFIFTRVADWDLPRAPSLELQSTPESRDAPLQINSEEILINLTYLRQ